MRDGALELACNATRSGVPVIMESWPGMIHGLHGLVNANVPEAESAWRAIKRFVEDV